MGLGDPMPATGLQQQLSNVRLEWKPLGAAFTGSLKSGRLVGNLRLFGATLPLSFERGR